MQLIQSAEQIENIISKFFNGKTCKLVNIDNQGFFYFNFERKDDIINLELVNEDI